MMTIARESDSDDINESVEAFTDRRCYRYEIVEDSKMHV